MIKTNTLVSIVTPAGEFVGKLESQTDTHVTLRTPKMIVHSEDQKMGFARGVCLTGEENPELTTFYSGGIILMTPSNDEIISAYTKKTSGIII